MAYTKRVIAAITFLICVFVSFQGAAQDSDTYAQEYALYEKAQAETNPSAQEALIMEFIKTYKESQLDQHISYLYAQQLMPLQQQGRWEQLASGAEKYLRYRPSDKNMAGLATEAYQKLGQPQKLVSFGTKLYQQAPSAATAYLVAKAYQSMNDTANFQKWAERTLRHAPNNAEMLVELVNASWQVQDMAKASQYAARAVKSLEASPQANQTKQAQAFCYRAMGEDAYINANFREAQKHFEKAAQLDPSVDFAHFRLGYCYWRGGKTDEAIRSFAKAVALKGTSARDARKELYTLLRQIYGNTSNAVGIIDSAAKELGISS